MQIEVQPNQVLKIQIDGQRFIRNQNPTQAQVIADHHK